MQIIGLLDSQSEALMTLYLRHALDFYAASVCCDWDRFITPSAAVPGSDNTQVRTSMLSIALQAIELNMTAHMSFQICP